MKKSLSVLIVLLSIVALVSCNIASVTEEIHKHNVLFDLNTESSEVELEFEEMEVIRNFKYGADQNLPEAARNGYVFDGWYTLPSGGSQVTEESKVPEANEETLYAHWTPITFLVTLKPNGGSASSTSSTVKYLGAYGTLPEATKTGSTFIGWFDKNNKKVITGSEFNALSAVTGYDKTKKTGVAGKNEIVLTAHWDTDYNIVFNLTNSVITEVTGDAPNSAYATPQAAVMVPATTATKVGYSFAGWSLSNNNSASGLILAGTTFTPGKPSGYPTNTTVNLYAVWTANKYKIDFYGDGGVVDYPSKEVTYGGTYGTLPGATRTGYEFDGWYTAKGTTGDVVAKGDSVSITANQKLYAHWTKLYTVKLELNGGSYSDSLSHEFKSGETFTIGSGAPTKSGCTFGGWYAATSIADDTKYYAVGENVTIETSDITLYAHWVSNQLDYEVGESVAVKLKSNATGKVEIPTYYMGKKVTEIGANPALSNTTLKSISIPKCVTTVDTGAFKGCSKLEEMTIDCAFTPNIIEGLRSAGTFESGLKTLTINNAGAIADGTFADLKALETITLKDVTTLGATSSTKAAPLTTTSATGVFDNCTSLTTVTILTPSVAGKKLVTIGDMAFAGCYSLKSITGLDDVQYVGVQGFKNCSALYEIYMPKVKEIHADAFYRCSLLEIVYLATEASGYRTSAIEFIGEEAFIDCIGLKHITSFAKITNNDYIKTKAFYNCADLIGLDISGLTVIPDELCYGCEDLVDLYLNNSETVLTVGKKAFQSSWKLGIKVKHFGPINIDVSNSNYSFYGTYYDDQKKENVSYGCIQIITIDPNGGNFSDTGSTTTPKTLYIFRYSDPDNEYGFLYKGDYKITKSGEKYTLILKGGQTEYSATTDVDCNFNLLELKADWSVDISSTDPSNPNKATLVKDASDKYKVESNSKKLTNNDYNFKWYYDGTEVKFLANVDEVSESVFTNVGVVSITPSKISVTVTSKTDSTNTITISFVSPT